MRAPEERAAPYEQAERAIVFADVCRSTQLFERYGNAEALRIVGRALAVLSDATHRYGGTVVKTIGDEVMATFPETPRAAEAAIAMQRAVKGDTALAEVGVCVKIGLHAGPVLLEEGDVYGDAVNVAARMTGLAKADQILTTRATVEHLSGPLARHTRGLGRSPVRGKEEAIELCELLWQQDREMLTNVIPSWEELKKRHEGRLTLQYESQEFVVEPHGPPFQIGRSPANDLMTQGKNVSRSHATIQFSNGHYVLTDRSTNGTYLRMGAEEVFLHRDQIHLLREGVISLGQALASAGADTIRYRCD
jgi:adenylate cyclase